MTVLMLHANLLEDQYPLDAEGLDYVENPMYKEFILWSQIAGPYLAANTPSFRTRFQQALVNGGGRIPPQAQRSKIRIGPSDEILNLSKQQLGVFLDLMDLHFESLVCEVLDWPQKLKLTQAQYDTLTPSQLPNSTLSDDEGNPAGQKSWEQWAGASHLPELVGGSWYISSWAGTFGNVPLCGSMIQLLVENNIIQNVITPQEFDDLS